MHARTFTASTPTTRPPANSRVLRRRLYTPNQVAMAAMLGGPLGGSIAMSTNLTRLGRRAAAVQTVVLGGAASAVLVALAMMLSLPFAACGLLGLAFALAVRTIAGRLQVDAARLQTPATGDASAWSAAGIGLAALLLQFVVLLAMLVTLTA